MCLALALAGVTAYLVRTGARCVVHDEKSLASLLSATVYRYSTFGQDDSIYLNAKDQRQKDRFLGIDTSTQAKGKSRVAQRRRSGC